MTEDEMLSGIIDAAMLGGWLVHHDRRGDLALTMGTPGFPDIVAVHPERPGILAWELKAARGRTTPAQVRWLVAMGTIANVRIIYPDSYDAAIEWLIGDQLVGITSRPASPGGRGDRGRGRPPGARKYGRDARRGGRPA